MGDKVSFFDSWIAVKNMVFILLIKIKNNPYYYMKSFSSYEEVMSFFLENKIEEISTDFETLSSLNNSKIN